MRHKAIWHDAKKVRSRSHLAVVGVSILVAVAIAAGGATVTQTPGATSLRASGSIHLTSAELKQWHNETATPFEREQIVEKMRAAFSGVAEVGAGPRPDQPDVSGAVGADAPATEPVSAGPTNVAQEDLSYGITGSDFWVVASYGDMARGAIWGAEQVCEYYYGVFGWLCDAAGSLLSSWSNGWGSANNHGVWATVYWWLPHYNAGRW